MRSASSSMCAPATERRPAPQHALAQDLDQLVPARWVSRWSRPGPLLRNVVLLDGVHSSSVPSLARRRTSRSIRVPCGQLQHLPQIADRPVALRVPCSRRTRRTSRNPGLDRLDVVPNPGTTPPPWCGQPADFFSSCTPRSRPSPRLPIASSSARNRGGARKAPSWPRWPATG